MLVIDDDVRRRQAFDGQGHEVVATVAEFLSRSRDHEVVSVDYDLYREDKNPGLTGLDAVRGLLDRGWRGRVVIHSHNARGALQMGLVLHEAKVPFKIRPFALWAALGG